jgi:hypothetical protein
MSRPKSARTLALEHDRAIRRERREQRRAEKEARRADREMRRQSRERARLAPTPVVEPQGGGIREALMYQVRLLCSKCGAVKLERDMTGPEVCEICYYSQEEGRTYGDL